MALENLGLLRYVSVEQQWLHHPQCGPANVLMVAKISICPPSVGEISNSVVILSLMTTIGTLEEVDLCN